MKTLIEYVFILSAVLYVCACSSSEERALGEQVSEDGMAVKTFECQFHYRLLHRNPDYSSDTIYIKVFRSSHGIDNYYLAAELIKKGNRIYRKILLWEVNTLMFILLNKRPYGRESWEYIFILKESRILADSWYLRPIRGEEYLKIKQELIKNRK